MFNDICDDKKPPLIDEAYLEAQHESFLDSGTGTTAEEAQQLPQEVILREESLDVSKIVPYIPDTETKAVDYRPQTLSSFVGQDLAKRKLKLAFKRIRAAERTHIFLDAIRGHGKSTLARIIAKELSADLIELTGAMITDLEVLYKIITTINTNRKLTVLFIDELDSLKREYFKFLNPILEEFKIATVPVRPFVFIGASILKHELLDKCPDTMDRIDVQIKFVRYTQENIATILKANQKKLYKDIQIPEDIYYKIADNCKYNPRVSLAMLKDYVYAQDLQTVLANNRIIKKGLNDLDIKLLQVLSKQKSVGAGALAQTVGLSMKEYTIEFEPYLVEFGYIARASRGRMITEKGVELLNSL